MKKYLAYSLITLGLLSGCGGGGGSSSSSTPTLQTGTFIDAPVAGLSYVTSSDINGTTNEKGEFSYKDGDTITFKLGDLVLGVAKGGSVISPKDLGDATKAANIAYLLQNLDIDGNASDSVIKLPDSQTLKEILTQTPITLDNTAQLEANMNTVKAQIEAKLQVNLPDVNVTEALTNMDSNLQQLFDFNVIVGKSYVVVDSSSTGGKIGAESAKFNSNGTLAISADWGSETVPYKIVRNDVLLSIWDDGTYYDYKVIIEQTDDYIATCSFSDDHALTSKEVNTKAATCTDIGSYLVKDIATANTIIEKLNSEVKLSTKAQITSIDTLNDKMFYQLNGTHGYIGVEAFKITNNADVSFYFSDNTHFKTEVPNDTMYNYQNYINAASFVDGKLYVINEYNGEREEWINTVYRYPLNGVTLTSQELSDEKMFDDKNLVNLLPNQSFTFTKGNMYCSMYFDECWVDKDAILEMIDQIP